MGVQRPAPRHKLAGAEEHTGSFACEHCGMCPTCRCTSGRACIRHDAARCCSLPAEEEAAATGVLPGADAAPNKEALDAAADEAPKGLGALREAAAGLEAGMEKLKVGMAVLDPPRPVKRTAVTNAISGDDSCSSDMSTGHQGASTQHKPRMIGALLATWCVTQQQALLTHLPSVKQPKMAVAMPGCCHTVELPNLHS